MLVVNKRFGLVFEQSTRQVRIEISGRQLPVSNREVFPTALEPAPNSAPKAIQANRPNRAKQMWNTMFLLVVFRGGVGGGGVGGVGVGGGEVGGVGGVG